MWHGIAGADVLLRTQRVEIPCGSLILNTAGLECSKCWDLKCLYGVGHVCVCVWGCSFVSLFCAI